MSRRKDPFSGAVLAYRWSTDDLEIFVVVCPDPKFAGESNPRWICVGHHPKDGDYVRSYDFISLDGCTRVA